VSTTNVSNDTGSRDPAGRQGSSRVDQQAPPELLISPELALIDPELAALARALLPDVPPTVRAGRSVPAPPKATAAAPPTLVARDDEPVPAPEPATAVRMRARRRAVLVAALPLVFVAGALTPSAIHRLDLRWARAEQVVEATPNPVVTSAGVISNAPGQPRRPSLRAGQSGGSPQHSTRNHSTPRLAANVLGVVVTPTRRGVQIAWRAPHGSARVVVVRYRGQRRTDGIVVYRGRRGAYTDSNVKAGTYDYVIRNYDRRGKGSSGVTSVVVVK